MNDAPPDEMTAELRYSDHGANFEQRIFDLSLFGRGVTTAAIFALFFGTYLALAKADAVSLFDASGIEDRTRLAVALSLLMAVILGIQRYVRSRDLREVPAFAKVLKGGRAEAEEILKRRSGRTRLGWASLWGAAAGLGADYLFYFSGGGLSVQAPLALKLWFAIVTLLILVLFARGVVLTRRSARLKRRTVEEQLVIDLLRIEQMTVWGRAAAQISLIWFTISAVTLLLFVSAKITLFTTLLLCGCLAMGAWVFIATMEPVHRKIRTCKADELERIRVDIAVARNTLRADAALASHLQSLLAYEARITAVADWPFDQPTLMRLGVSALVLGVPWFGEAVAQYRVSHLVQ